MTMALDGCSLTVSFLEDFFFAVDDDNAEAGEENNDTNRRECFGLTKASSISGGTRLRAPNNPPYIIAKYV